MFGILNADLRIVLFVAFLPFIGIGHCRQEAKMGLGKVHELGLELGQPKNNGVIHYVGTLPKRLLVPRI